MEIATNWVVDQIGFAGLCLILFITDTLVTPFPPDILLVVIACSDLAEHWLIYLLVLGLASVVAGMLGWCLGRWLRHLKFFQRLFGQFNEEQRTFIAKYGFWPSCLAQPRRYPIRSATGLQAPWCAPVDRALCFNTVQNSLHHLLPFDCINRLPIR